MRIHARVGAEGDLHAGPHRLAEVLALQPADLPLLLEDLVRVTEPLVFREDVVVVVDVGDQVGASLLHEADPLVVDQAAVLDRRHPGAHGALDRLGAVGVRRHLPPPHRGLLHHGVHLFLRELRRTDRFLFGQHAGAGEQLDEVRAILDLEADQLADLVHSVGQPGELAELEVWREADDVAVAAGGTDGQRRDLHPRTDTSPGVDGTAQSDVDELAGANVPDRGEAGLERAPREGGCGHGVVDRTAAEEALVVVSGVAAR